MKILVIDDDDAVLNYIREILRHDGFNVLTTDNGSTAFEKLARNCDVTAVITDIIMPEEEGIEIIKKIKSEHPHIKIVAISGGGKMSPQSYLQLAYAVGADATLRKPFGHKELLNTLQNL
ncbi:MULTISPECIES: response regulator [Prosthecochloris]|uniref:Response regulator n=1 Tax=Prosthecochloris marina TaxID=2017681 RepID=A0A317T6U4_9CHLB|nr:MULTISPECIES: response regulator [Prosthecochloris]PWW82393.1 response regulator [Prosthecochloris marina]UZJ37376.1 response regulator [Prosthecochloris sp. SCSIO W1103]UZJ39198.1 response regulator [Prosthecochloris sp. SCSIO W1102]UZJ41170.1 response regulator [Prosthecochloris sp. SCSIO W1101]